MHAINYSPVPFGVRHCRFAAPSGPPTSTRFHLHRLGASTAHRPPPSYPSSPPLPQLLPPPQPNSAADPSLRVETSRHRDPCVAEA
ncbi:hypothetical protein LINGRAHAP2_LOCUS20193 [Linum grandiflorum]